MKTQRTILYCNCSYKDLIPEARKQKAREVLGQADAKVVAVPDLCELATHHDPRLATLAATPSLTIAACYPRAIQWLFRWAGHPLRDDVELVNLRTTSPDALAEELPKTDDSPQDQVGRAFRPVPPEAVTPTGDWVPWFPIIDYDACTNCKQCLSFCPFGVYAQSDEGKVVVTSPENCKNNCPACARVCPAVAIIFPKVIDRPINGAAVNPADLEQAKHRIEEQKKELAEKGILSVLAQRKLRALARRMAEQYTGATVEESA